MNKKARPLLEILNPQPNQWHDHESKVVIGIPIKSWNKMNARGSASPFGRRINAKRKSVHSYSWC